MLMFTLAISYLITSNSPSFMDLTFQVPVEWSIGLYSHHQIHPQLGAVSTLVQPLLSFWSYFSIHTYWPGEFIFQCPIFLPVHTVDGVLRVRMLQWFATSFSGGLGFVRTLHHEPSWVALHGMAHSFIELDKAVIHFINLVSFLWLWFSFCLSSDGWG